MSPHISHQSGNVRYPTLLCNRRFARNLDFAVEIAVRLRHTACHKFLGPTCCKLRFAFTCPTRLAVEAEHRYSPAKQIRRIPMSCVRMFAIVLALTGAALADGHGVIFVNCTKGSFAANGG